MWTVENRVRYARGNSRYPSAMTDGEWLIIEPLIPPARQGGRRRSVSMRDVVNALFYVLETGCQWRHLPKDFPPKSTVYDYFQLWTWDQTLENIHDTLCVATRKADGHEASPSAGIVDSQSVKSASKGGGGSIRSAMTRKKKIKGIKRHVMTDHCGLMLALAIHPGDVQGRDGFGLVASKQTRRRFPFIEVIFADGGYRGDKVRETAAETGAWRVEIITRNEADMGFVVQARRWIVERTLAWISRHRRLAKDLECLTRTAIAFVRLAMIKIMLRRLGRQPRE